MLNAIAISSSELVHGHVAHCNMTANFEECNELQNTVFKVALIGAVANGAFALDVIWGVAAVALPPFAIHASIKPPRAWFPWSLLKILGILAFACCCLRIGVRASFLYLCVMLSGFMAPQALPLLFTTRGSTTSIVILAIARLAQAKCRQRQRDRLRILRQPAVPPRLPEAGDVCIICLDPLLPASAKDGFLHDVDCEPLSYCMYGCGRPVHRHCVQGWLRHADCCPLCRCPWAEN